MKTTVPQFVHAGANVPATNFRCDQCAHTVGTYQEWNNSDGHVVCAANICDRCGAEQVGYGSRGGSDG